MVKGKGRRAEQASEESKGLGGKTGAGQAERTASSQRTGVGTLDSESQMRVTGARDVAHKRGVRRAHRDGAAARKAEQSDEKCARNPRRESVSWQPNCGSVLEGLQHRAHNLLELEQPRGLKSNSEGKN